MRTLKYLNFVLTVIALLLSAVLWTLWTHPDANFTAPAQAQGLSDAGAQRAEQIAQLKQLAQKVEELTGLFKNGSARVKVENLKSDDAARR